MDQPIQEEAKPSPVETPDLSEESIDEQCVQLAQAKLDGRIDDQTYERLIALLRGEKPRNDWTQSLSIEYAAPDSTKSPDISLSRSVLAIVGLLILLLLLVALFSPKYDIRSSDARLTATKTDIANLEIAFGAFQIDTGRYPTTAEGLASLLTPPSGVTNWHGPYIKASGVPVDPWGLSYIYRFPSKRYPRGFDLLSAGPDGKIGTADDISN